MARFMDERGELKAMTADEILTQIEAINAGMNVFRFAETYIKPKWHVNIKWENKEGTRLEVERKGESFEEGLEKAWEEFDRITRRGVPLARLAAPLEVRQEVEIDDEIPF